ncbi:MAG: hypothetical protein WAX14_18840 [Rhodococcus sp. (in: high G+C Gram-positive bacteria)]|uniref:hypothetical protein n=1 Tax=Rhodococcus sp. TaxID=1831 RepID=UPI003BB6B0E2
MCAVGDGVLVCAVGDDPVDSGAGAGTDCILVEEVGQQARADPRERFGGKLAGEVQRNSVVDITVSFGEIDDLPDGQNQLSHRLGAMSAGRSFGGLRCST